MKVLLRNPRRELEVEGPLSVVALLRRLDINRESVLVIKGDTLVTADALLDDADTIEIRPVISGGLRVKCTVCRQPSVMDVRRHNAGFCAEHFLKLCRDQVAKAIHEHDMIGRDERVLVAVSGGKDSLALWDILLELGYDVDGFCIGLGIGEYSKESTQYARDFASARGLRLVVTDLREDHGFDVPTAAHVTNRVPCSACGMSKRHLFDAAALEGGYDVVATGHNLDDEAAVLFGNVLRWNADYLGRQRPVLDAKPGFPRKVKPLIRLYERETAAYCVLRGIDYIVEECPVAAGNKHLGYKEALNAIEVQSPGTKHDFYFGFLRNAVDRFPSDLEESGGELLRCARCGAPTTSEVCSFCRLVERTHDVTPVQLGQKPAGREREARP